MNFPKVEKTSLTDRVAEILYEKIVNGEISPGERLPSEMELSEQLGVARPTVREALNRLIGLGLIKRGGYTMVVSENGSMSTRAGLTPLLLDQWEVRELYEARYMIEVDLVALAIQKATEEDIQELRLINDQLKSDCVSERSYWDIDMQFHTSIAAISCNHVMQEISKIINNMYKRYEQQIEQLHEVKKMTYRDHETLIDAIEKRDESLAASIVLRMLTKSELALRDLLGKKE